MTDKTPTDAQQYLNVASQCAATATSELTTNVLVDGGSGTLRELLNDAADAIRAGWGQPAQVADSVLEDAARYRWLREGNDAKHGAAWHVAVNLYGCEWDAAIDAAMNKGATP